MTPGASFLFPGQLAEYPGMGRDLAEADPAARELFDSTSERCGIDLRRIVLEGPEAELHENLPAQAGVFLVSTLAARALERAGVAPAATAGYSLGNYAALVAAGAVSYEEALDVLIAVWRETERLGIRGAMGAVVGARREAVEDACGDLRARGLPVWIGNVNAATQFVLTGSVDGVREALAALAPRALSVLTLGMNWPIHSELMLPVAEAIAPVMASCRSIRAPRVACYGPEGAMRSAEEIRDLLASGFCRPTLWNRTFEAMVADGHRTFLEVGPGEMLSKMTRWIDRTVHSTPAGTVAAIRQVSDRVAPS
jgi:[acyl-carrier-protein] S-malonyltransferase